MKRSRFYKHQKWHKIILIMIFLLSSGSAGQPTAVQAAPPAQDVTNVSTRYHFSILIPPDPICAGQDYDIIVTPLKDGDGKFKGQKFTYDTKNLVGITIGALVKNKSIGTLSPSKQISGFAWAVANALEDTDPQENPGEALFKFHAKKAGETELYFEALINGQYVAPAVPIKVVNCAYRVTMKYKRKGPIDIVTGSMPGTLIKSSDGQALTGEGLFTFTQIVTRLPPPCTYSISTLQSPTGIKANIVNPNASPLILHLSFDYAEATQTTIAKCKLGQLGTAAGQDTRQEDPDWFLDLPEVDFQEPWGTKKFPALNGGSMWITVVPVAP